MSTGFQTNTYLNKDTRIEYLLFGYIRNIKIIDQIIPSSIIFLCIQFYNAKLNIIAIHNSYNSPSNIFIAELGDNKRYKCNIESLNNNKKFSMMGLRNTGICYAENVKLPHHLLSKFQHKLNNQNIYDVLFMAGSFNNRGRCDSFIINNDIDIFHLELPSLSFSANGAYLVYSDKYGLIRIGSFADTNTEKTFNAVTIDDNNEFNEDEWKH